MIHVFESRDFASYFYECNCFEDEDPEYYQTFAFCDTHHVWARHIEGHWSGWVKIDPEVADKIVPVWMLVKAYSKL